MSRTDKPPKGRKKPDPPSELEEESSNWPDIPTLQDVFDAIKERKEEEED
jgi:hypothetical protein